MPDRDRFLLSCDNHVVNAERLQAAVNRIPFEHGRAFAFFYYAWSAASLNE